MYVSVAKVLHLNTLTRLILEFMSNALVHLLAQSAIKLS